jgi:hypothetical protein
MRHLEFSRPARTATGKARNAGEAAQQLAHVTRERLRLGQERKALLARIQKIDGRLGVLSALEDKLVPMVRKEADRAKGAQSPLQPPSPAPPIPAAAPPARQISTAPLAARQVSAAPPARQVSAAPPPAPRVSAAPSVPPVRRATVLPIGLTEVTLQY